jgi:hypothetical protein
LLILDSIFGSIFKNKNFAAMKRVESYQREISDKILDLRNKRKKK